MKKAKIKSRLTTFIFSFQFFISLCLCVSAVNFYSTNRAQAQTGGTFTITKSVIAGGGGRTAGGAFTLDGSIGQSVAGTTSTGGAFNLQSGFWSGGVAVSAPRRSPFDYDGDGRTDFSVFRPSNGIWYLQRTTAGFFGINFGNSTDRITPWYRQNSSNGTFNAFPFGLAADKPTPSAFQF